MVAAPLLLLVLKLSPAGAQFLPNIDSQEAVDLLDQATGLRGGTLEIRRPRQELERFYYTPLLGYRTKEPRYMHDVSISKLFIQRRSQSEQTKLFILPRIFRSLGGGGETTSDVQKTNAILKTFVAR